MKRIIWVVIGFLIISTSCQQQPTTQPDVKKQTLAVDRGFELYTIHCQPCHGPKGQGNGPQAKYMSPRPHDFSKGIFKYKSTQGILPSDINLMQIMKKGIPGTAMPGWDILPLKDWRALVVHLKKIVPALKNNDETKSIDIPAAPPVTKQTILAGEKIFKSRGCVQCHGEDGTGETIATKVQNPNQVSPRNLRKGPYKWGGQKQRHLSHCYAWRPGDNHARLQRPLNTHRVVAVDPISGVLAKIP